MQVKVIRSNRKTMCIEITKQGEVLVRVPYRMTNAEIQRFLESKSKWIAKHLESVEQNKSAQKELSQEELNRLVQEAKKILPQRVEYFANLMGVSYGRITIRNQKTRWGSCSSKGNLNFNCMLMLTPPEVQDYVVVHELCHRKEMNHSKQFWAEVENILPDYKERRKILKRYLCKV